MWLLSKTDQSVIMDLGHTAKCFRILFRTSHVVKFAFLLQCNEYHGSSQRPPFLPHSKIFIHKIDSKMKLLCISHFIRVSVLSVCLLSGSGSGSLVSRAPNWGITLTGCTTMVQRDWTVGS